MFFDATGAKDGSVLEIVEKLFGCCVPTEQSAGQKKPTPPLVVLQWGSISTFPAVITSVSAKYTLFRSDGTPIRAICSVSMEEMPGSPPRQNPTSGSDSIRRVHRTIVGDNLASIAYAEYGDPAHWRPLAAYNGVDDPLRLPTRAHDPAALPGGDGGDRMTGSMCLVEIDGSPMPADLVPLAGLGARRGQPAAPRHVLPAVP